MNSKNTKEFEEKLDKIYFKGLTGQYKHYCPEWDFLPIDETTPEWECCKCYPEHRIKK